MRTDILKTGLIFKFFDTLTCCKLKKKEKKKKTETFCNLIVKTGSNGHKKSDTCPTLDETYPNFLYWVSLDSASEGLFFFHYIVVI